MVEEGASERLGEILIEKRDSISREDLLKYIRSNFKNLSLKAIAKNCVIQTDLTVNLRNG